MTSRLLSLLLPRVSSLYFYLASINMKHPLITRGQAACIFYGEAINPANELICEARIDSIPGVEICYIDNDPSEPFLVAEKRILFSPFRYQCYPPEISTAAHAADPTDLANAPSSLIR